MVIVPLSGGFHAELRDQLKGGDFRLAHEALTIRFTGDGVAAVTGAAEEAIKYVLLARLITRWTIPGKPVPAASPDPQAVLDDLPADDLHALMDAVHPAYERVMAGRDQRCGPPAARPELRSRHVIAGEVIHG